jgi:hypothetical protein
MSLYLYQNDQQTGPFTGEQIQEMLRAGTVTRDTLGWKEGLADWSPLSSLLPALEMAIPLPPPPPKPRSSRLGIISFIIALVSMGLWAALFLAAGIAHNNGSATQTFDVIIGFILMAGVAVNFMAMVLGAIGIFKSKANTLAIIGTCMNGFLLLAVIGLVIIGLMAKGSQ